ncbi:hypothetical protein PRIPAC_82265, partial [Pristionchus pacificus]|uniref:G protein-coupled receptor n=1 Tax=Pristionchus pacificus TaxID=54126 RepID=A0A2A6CIW7_PRIPA
MEFRSLLAIISSLFVFATSTVNLLILAVILSRRRPFYHSCFFYVIYMVGIFIDLTSLVSSHLLALVPSKGIFIDVFLSSTTLGRIFLFFAWSTRACQGFTNFHIALNRVTAILSPFDHRKIWASTCVRGTCFLVQFGIGITIGVWAAKSDVYWSQTSHKSWYIQFVDTRSTHIFFRFVFGGISFLSTLTIVAYVVLLLHLRSQPVNSERHQRRGTRDGDMKNEQYMLHLAVCVCTLEILYYLMYSYAFVMNANFELDLETVYVWYFLVTDLYSGVPPFVLLIFSTPIREDVGRLLSRLLHRKRNTRTN